MGGESLYGRNPVQNTKTYPRHPGQRLSDWKPLSCSCEYVGVLHMSNYNSNLNFGGRQEQKLEDGWITNWLKLKGSEA